LMTPKRSADSVKVIASELVCVPLDDPKRLADSQLMTPKRSADSPKVIANELVCVPLDDPTGIGGFPLDDPPQRVGGFTRGYRQ
jgi:hypothetical protein